MGTSSGSPGVHESARISDSSISRYRILQYDTSNTTNYDRVMKAATASSQAPAGITNSATTAANQIAGVRQSGIAKLEVNGNSDNISPGDYIVATAAGVGVKAAAVSATAQYPVGIAQAPSTADGDIIEVLLTLGVSIGKYTS